MALEGVMMTQGFGFLQYDKNTGKMGGMLPSLFNMFKGGSGLNQSTTQFVKAFEMNAMNNLDAEAIDKLAESIGGVDKAVVNSAKGFAQSGQSIAQWKAQATSAAASGQALKGVLMSIGGILGSMAIAWGISELIEGANALINAQDHMVSAAKGYQSAVEGIKTSMSSYQSQVSSLSETLRSDDATTEQKVQARKDLIALQQKLVEEYGKEPGAISDINAIINTATSTMDGYSSAIDKTSDAWSRLAKSAMDSAKRSSDAQDSWWQKFANKALYGTESSVQASLDQYKKYYNEIRPAGIFKTNIGQSKELVKYIESIGGINSPNGWSFDGSAKEVLEKYEQIYSKAVSLGNVNESWLNDLQTEIDNINNLIDNTAEYRNFYTEDLINYTDEYSKARDSINTLYDEYNNAIAENKLELASNLREQIVSQLSKVEQTASQDPEVKDWFANTFGEFQKDIDLSDFTNRLNDEIIVSVKTNKANATRNVRKSYQEIFEDALEGIEYDERFGNRAATLEELQRMASLYSSGDLTKDKGYTEKQIQSFKDLASAAADAGYDIQAVLVMLNQLGQIDTLNLQDAKEKFIPRNASEEYKAKMEEYLRSLEESGELETAIALDIEIDKKDVDATIQQIKDGLNAKAEETKAFTIEFDVEKAKAGLEAIQTALSSTDGLTEEMITGITNYFKELDSFDSSKLFQETANGIQLNLRELERLNSEMESVSYDKLLTDQKEIVKQYDEIVEAMSRVNKTDPEYGDLENQLQQLRESAKAAHDAAYEYYNLNSAYQKFVKAQSTPDQSAAYVAVSGKYEEMKKLADAGRWGNDDLKTYLNLFSYEDTSNAGIEKQQELWASLNKTIEGTNKTKLDFFKLDSNGDVTLEGAVNLANAINQKFGDAYARLEDGMWVLDLTGDKFSEVAQGLTMSESLLDITLQSLSEYGYEVERSFNLATPAVERLGITIEEAKEKFNDLGFDFNFDENSASISELNGYIQTLEIFANKNLTDTGAFDMNVDGMKEASVLLDELVRKRQQLEDQNIEVMNIKTDGMEQGLQKTVDLLKSIRTNAENIELGKINAVPEVDLQQYKQNIIDALSQLSSEDLSQYVDKLNISDLFEIDESNIDSKLGEIQSKVESLTSEEITGKPLEIEAKANTEGLSEDIDQAVDENDGKEITVGTNVDKTNVDSFKTEIENSEVNLPVKPSVSQAEIDKVKSQISGMEAHVTVKADIVKGTSTSTVGKGRGGYYGGAGAYGGAFAGGKALVGELGRELVVDPHNGTYQTVGDRGAEFVNLPKDAIVFNHWQTKRLFQGSNPGRGFAFAQGNAFEKGNAYRDGDADIVWTMGLKTAFSDIPKIQKQLKETSKIAQDAISDVNESVESSEDAMSTLSGQLDEIQSAYQSLKDIMDTYNETGSITIDQAQTLMQTDFRYLALLSDENGVLGLNEAGFESLAQAKLQEMQITMIRNAIDTVNSLTSEAAAADYLSNSYLNLGQSALSASQMTLQAAVNAAHARGAMQGAAADMIAQGVNNAMTLMQNVGLNSGQKAEGGGGGGGAEEAPEEEAEEQSVEKDLDWIERLLERLTKLTKKWTDQADRFFSFWNKNWALSKALKANREEISANKKAYSYYMTKAGEVELDQEYVKLVKNGAISIETIDDQELSDKIDAYQQW